MIILVFTETIMAVCCSMVVYYYNTRPKACPIYQQF